LTLDKGVLAIDHFLVPLAVDIITNMRAKLMEPNDLKKTKFNKVPTKFFKFLALVSFKGV